MKKLPLMLTFTCLMIFLGSCATIVRNKNQLVSIRSNVEKTSIKITNKSGSVIYQGQTPILKTLKTASIGYFSPEKYTITATKDGYKSTTATIDWHISKWYSLGNILVGGLIGYLIVDPISGNMYYLDQYIKVNMAPLPKE